MKAVRPIRRRLHTLESQGRHACIVRVVVFECFTCVVVIPKRAPFHFVDIGVLQNARAQSQQ